MTGIQNRIAPLGPILGALLLVAPAQTTWAARTGDLPALRQHALELVNEARREHGRESLTLSDPLSQAAQDHARDMLERGYYGHVSPGGEDVQDRYLARGGEEWELVQENISSCSPCAEVPDAERVRELHRGWMESPEHRENILRAGITGFGFGIIAGENGQLYAVQTFAGPGTAPGEADGDATPLPPGEADSAFARALNARREADSLPPLEVSPELSALASRLLPDSAAGEIDLEPEGGLIAALPREARQDWRSLSVLAGSCGGCGAEPVDTDIDRFLGMWLEDTGYARRLLGTRPTALGFALRAYGGGRKVAVAILGEGD